MTKKYMTPDLSMSRDEVEKIVREAAPKSYAELGLDRLLTTAQMVHEFESGNLEDEEFYALLAPFDYCYTGTRRKIDTGQLDWMELINFRAVADMIRTQAPSLLGKLGLERLCTVRRMALEYAAGNLTEDQLITLCSHYDMGIFTPKDPANWLDYSLPTEEGNYGVDLESARDEGLISWDLYDAINKEAAKVTKSHNS